MSCLYRELNDPFCCIHLSNDSVPMLFSWLDNPPKLSLPMGNLDPMYIIWFLVIIGVSPPNGISIGSAVFA